MTRLCGVLLALSIPLTLVGQFLDHALISSPADVPSARRSFSALPDTIDVLAVMVQFQQDTDSRSSGTGQFDLSTVTTADVPIDAPPRNAAYFHDHLDFLASYYKQVSKGKVIIRATLIPDVITLPSVMARYSPVKNGPNTPVADLARDTWRRADSLGVITGIETFEAFIVFHAGVGRDIDLVGALGYDPAPLDIPSLYLGAGAFQEAHGSPGIPVRGGSFLVPNSLIIPETESRSVPGLTGDVFLEYGINGLLCASLGNYLGLPDLFDTKTGRSGIGGFGLMDGQSIFSFSGAFPPEPSAWEKYWLGWIEPIQVQPGSTLLSLPAVALADSIYRVPIGAREYYLVENRNRDPRQDGQRITMVVNGATKTQSFARDTAGFNAFDISALEGSVTAVEDFDWSLPGGVDNAGTFYDGGILIWHIDESVIASDLATNTINANPSRRGVDVEEADGSQDIGQEYGFLSAGGGSENGTALDFWYQGNSSPVNKNTFGANTYPPTLSNDGALAHVTMQEFSARGPRMSVRVIVGDEQIQPLAGFPKETRRQLPPHALTVAPPGPTSSPGIFVTTVTTASPPIRGTTSASAPAEAIGFGWRIDGKPVLGTGRGDGTLLQGDGARFLSGTSVTDLNADGVADILVGASGVGGFARGYTLQDTNSDSLADPLFSLQLTAPSGMPPLPEPDHQTGLSAFPPIPGPTLLAVAGDSGSVRWVTKGGVFIATERVLADATASVAGISRFASLHSFIITGTDGTVAIRSRMFPSGAITGDPRRTLGQSIAGPAASGTFGSAVRIAVGTTDGWVYLLNDMLETVPGFPVKAGTRLSDPPAIADVDGDGQRDIVVFSGNRILVWNAAGVLADNFPVILPTEDALLSAPVVGDVNGDGLPDIVGATERGLLVAYDRTGKPVSGFPLLAGSGRHSVAIFTATDSIIVAAASGEDGSVSAWLTGRATLPVQASRYPWPQFQRDAAHSGLDTTRITGTSPSTDFFPPSRAYNWPNPAYDGKTMIRYFVRETAAVQIKIYDMAGDLVTSLVGPGIAGLDNEVVWDLSQVQSGVYFAHIEASAAVGNGSTVIKIAVVK